MTSFSIPPVIEFATVFFVGISGALVGVRRGYDVVGIFFLTLITALGGAFLRDGIFLQNGPPVFLSDDRYLLFVLAATIVGMFFRTKIHRIGRLVSLMDAFGLSAYAIIGATKAMDAGIAGGGVILIGVINGVGGGMMRDVCTREEPMIFRPGEFYALVAVFGTTAFVGIAHYKLMAVPEAAYLCVFLMLVARWLTITLHWHTKSFVNLYGKNPDMNAVSPAKSENAGEKK